MAKSKRRRQRKIKARRQRGGYSVMDKIHDELRADSTRHPIGMGRRKRHQKGGVYRFGIKGGSARSSDPVAWAGKLVNFIPAHPLQWVPETHIAKPVGRLS